MVEPNRPGLLNGDRRMDGALFAATVIVPGPMACGPIARTGDGFVIRTVGCCRNSYSRYGLVLAFPGEVRVMDFALAVSGPARSRLTRRIRAFV